MAIDSQDDLASIAIIFSSLPGARYSKKIDILEHRPQAKKLSRNEVDTRMRWLFPVLYDVVFFKTSSIFLSQNDLSEYDMHIWLKHVNEYRN